MDQNLSAETQFWLLTGDVPTGPFDVRQIHAKLAAGEVTWETRACAAGASTWLPLHQMPGVGPTSAADTCPAAVPVAPISAMGSPGPASAAKAAQVPASAQAPRPSSDAADSGTGSKSGGRVGWWGGGGGFALAMLCVVVNRYYQDKPKVSVPAPPTKPPIAVQRAEPAAVPTVVPELTAPAALARINVTAADGTAALQSLAAQLPPAQARALGLSVLLTGVDVYGIKVRVSNTGTVPIRVFPGNLRVHYGREAVGVTTANHPLFLQPCVVQPGYYVEGLVLYQAAVDVGAVIRLLGTSFSYDDPSIVVTYNQ